MTTENLGGVVVTGSARGIGLAIARSAAKTGYGVSSPTLMRRGDPRQRTQSKLPGAGPYFTKLMFRTEDPSLRR